MNIRTDLPKMYRVVYGRFEYVHDSLVNGEHVQDCGDYYSQVRRVITSDGWKWQALWLNEFDRYGLYWLNECSNSYEEDERLEWVVKAPSWLDEMEDYEREEYRIAEAKPPFASIKARNQYNLETEELNRKFKSFWKH